MNKNIQRIILFCFHNKVNMLNDVPFVHSMNTWEMFIPGQPLLTGYATVHKTAMSYLTTAFNIKYVVYDLIQSSYVKTKYVGVRQDKLHFRILAEVKLLYLGPKLEGFLCLCGMSITCAD